MSEDTVKLLNEAIDKAQEMIKKAVEQLNRKSINRAIEILADASAILDFDKTGRCTDCIGEYVYDEGEAIWIAYPGHGTIAGIVIHKIDIEHILVELIAGPIKFKERIVVKRSQIKPREV